MSNIYYLDENMVQIWKEPRYEKIILINHLWRTRDKILKKGFKLFFQEVTLEQLDALKKMKTAKTENEYEELKKQIGELLFRKLVKYDYLVKESTKRFNRQVWHSQAGEYLSKYLKSMYAIDYPGRPTRVLLLPTLRCTGNCIFCITNSKAKNDHHELDLETWRNISYRVSDELQPCSVDVVGGEPLLRSDVVLEIARIMAKKNILLKIITNGLAFSNTKRVEEFYEVLKDAKHNIQISFDGFKKEHNMIRPGVDYDKVMKAIQNISQVGFTFGINLTINKLNLPYIEKLISELIQYNPTYFLIGPLQVSPKDIELCTKIMINSDEEKQLREIVEKVIEKYPNITIKFDKDEPIYEKESIGFGSRKGFHSCTSFFEEMSIGPEGNLISCLRGTAFEELWGPTIAYDSKNYAEHWLLSDLACKFRSIPLSGKCAICEYNQQCNQGCPLETYVLKGSLGGFDPHCTYKPANILR